MQYRDWIEWVERPVMERPYLLVYACYDQYDGDLIAIIKNTPENIAALLVSPELKTEEFSMHQPVVLVTDQSRFVLSTMEFLGLVDECPHQRWLAEQLIPVLAPIQTGETAAPEVVKASDELTQSFNANKLSKKELEAAIRELWPESFAVVDKKREAVARVRAENSGRIEPINREIAPFNIMDAMDDESEAVKYCLFYSTGKPPYQKAFNNWIRSKGKRVKEDRLYTYGNGQDWEKVFKTAFADDENLKRIDFDSEAGMFSVSADDLDLLRRFAVALKLICDDTKRFEGLIDRVLDADGPFLPF